MGNVKSPLSCPCLISYTEVLDHLPNEPLRCSISLLLASNTAILHKAVGCPAHGGCSGWLTSNEHQRAITQPGQCASTALDGGDVAENTKKISRTHKEREISQCTATGPASLHLNVRNEALATGT